jgi:(p)ppGpp synthase/HD superfamily hydrolase
MTTLEKAVSLALQAHDGILDKGGAPYILHALRIMLQMDTVEEMMAAVLHDALEDGDVDMMTLEDAGFSPGVVDAVDSLTRRENEAYEAYIERVALNETARKIKKADLLDNLNLSRLTDLNPSDFERIQTYHRALVCLGNRPSAGHFQPQGPRTLYLGEI